MKPTRPRVGGVASDLIDGPTLVLRYTATGLIEHIEYTRVICTENLDVASGNSGKDAAVVGLQAVQTKYPVGAGDANIPLAICRGYAIRDCPSDSSAVWGASFMYDAPAWSTQVWHVESDSYGEAQETPFQYDDSGNPIPISVGNYRQQWTNPNEVPPLAPDNVTPFETPQEPDFGTVIVPKSVKVWEYTRQIISEADAVAFDKGSLDYDQRLNSVTFTGLNGTNGINQGLNCSSGTVLCQRIKVTFDPYENLNLATVVLAYKPEGWQPYVAYRLPPEQGGFVPANTWAANPPGTDGNGAGVTVDWTATPHQYPANGVVRTTAYRKADLNQLLNLLTGTNQSPFPTGS